MKMGKYSKACFLLCMIILGGVLYLLYGHQEEGPVFTIIPDNNQKVELDLDEVTIEEMNYVFICGAVTYPGVYEFDSGARVFEALEAAGGLTEEADPYFINQVAVLMDGQMIYFPTKDEVAEGFSQIQETSSHLININTATLSELQSIPGIGEVKAKSIIDYRNKNGKFQTKEDIMKIDGIKEGTFNKIQNFITV